jgi:hypothetical protein
MFRPLSHFDLIHYSLPEVKDAGSEIEEDNYVLASFLKGEKVFEEISRRGIFHRKLYDVGNAWSNFDIFQLYSPYKKVTKESVDILLSSQASKLFPSLLGKGICDSPLVTQKCTIDNRLRVIKIGSTKSISPLKLRAVPVAILQRLGISEQVFPICNFYLKIRLSPRMTNSFIY